MNSDVRSGDSTEDVEIEVTSEDTRNISKYGHIIQIMCFVQRNTNITILEVSEIYYIIIRGDGIFSLQSYQNRLFRTFNPAFTSPSLNVAVSDRLMFVCQTFLFLSNKRREEEKKIHTRFECVKPDHDGTIVLQHLPREPERYRYSM